jgi:hypothetical protein
MPFHPVEMHESAQKASKYDAVKSVQNDTGFFTILPHKLHHGVSPFELLLADKGIRAEKRLLLLVAAMPRWATVITSLPGRVQ